MRVIFVAVSPLVLLPADVYLSRNYVCSCRAACLLCANATRKRRAREEIMEHKRPYEGYGGGGFEVSGQDHRGSVLVLPDRVLPWPVAEAGAISLESLQPLVAAAANLEVLLVGCGERAVLLPRPLREALRGRGLGVDAMATGPACRTFNVLQLEARAVAAALIAVD